HNGTLELGAQPDIRLREHRRNDWITHLLPVTYDPEKGCPLYHKFLDRVQPDLDQQRFLHKVLGDYAATVPVETFVEHRFGRGPSDATPDIARLPGKRLVIASEPERQARIAESLIKVAT